MGTSLARAQYEALIEVRLRLFANLGPLSSPRAKVTGRAIGIAIGGLILMLVGLAFWIMARHACSRSTPGDLSLVVWRSLAVWQLLPLLLFSLQDQVDLTSLRRFPITFRSYCIVYFLFSASAFSSLAGWMSLFGIWAGVGLGWRTGAWIPFSLALFGTFNVLFSCALSKWANKWLSQVRSRLIIGTACVVAVLAVELAKANLHELILMVHDSASMFAFASRVERLSPAGLLASLCVGSDRQGAVGSLFVVGVLAVYVCGTWALLHVRLYAEYRGENRTESQPSLIWPESRPERSPCGKQLKSVKSSSLSKVARTLGSFGALLGKEIRCLRRTGVLLFGLAMPQLVMLFGRRGMLPIDPDLVANYALPLGVAFSFLPFSRQVCNSLGGEGSGIQFYLLSPTPFRTAMLAKNVLQIGIFCIEAMLAYAITSYRAGPPTPEMVSVTLAWLLFAVPVQLAVGNVLSITMTYPMTLIRFSNVEGASLNGFVSLMLQLGLVGVGAGVYLQSANSGQGLLATRVFLSLAAAGIVVWGVVLFKSDNLLASRRERLLAVLVRTR